MIVMTAFMLLPLGALALRSAILPQVVPFWSAQPAIDPHALELGDFISFGKYGAVSWAQLDGNRCVAKRASDGAEWMETPSVDELKLAAVRSAEYLETEALVNRLMNERAPSLELHSQMVAPYLGTCVKEGCRYLVWRAAGVETLDDYLCDAQRLPELARALDCSEKELPRRVLHDVLRCLAHVHACGIAHRDIKPGNVLVDVEAHTLRLIDFGSAADCSGWLVAKRGGLRDDRLPLTVLFTAAGSTRFDDRASWYKFDIYAAALVWLCVAVPELAADDELLYELRIALRDHENDPDAWRRSCDGEHGAEQPSDGCAVPASKGFGRVFGWRAARPLRQWRRVFRIFRKRPTAEGGEGGEQERAWQLLTSLLELDPSRRPSAAEALLGKYLNYECSEAEMPMSAPEPWTIEALVGSVGAAPPRVMAADECALPPGE